jgi:predicted DNA-binding transcriptional regulator AlpA
MNDAFPLRVVALPAADRPTPASALEPLLLSARDVAALLRLSLRTIRSMDAAGRLPEPLRLSPGCVRWKFSEIRDWVNFGAPDRETWARIRGARK